MASLLSVSLVLAEAPLPPWTAPPPPGTAFGQTTWFGHLTFAGKYNISRTKGHNGPNFWKQVPEKRTDFGSRNGDRFWFQKWGPLLPPY